MNKGSLLGLGGRHEKVQRSAGKENMEETCTHRPNLWVLLERHRGMCSEDWPGVVGKARPLSRLLAGGSYSKHYLALVSLRPRTWRWVPGLLSNHKPQTCCLNKDSELKLITEWPLT